MPKELSVEIPAPNIQLMSVEIKGRTPLIFHKWSEKAKEMIRKKQRKDPEAGKREIREPEQEYRNSFYVDSDGFIAFPVLAIKQAMVNAARNIEGLHMTLLRGAVFVVGDEEGMVQVLQDGKPIKVGEELTPFEVETRPEGYYSHDTDNTNLIMREDMVRVGRGVADLRYRGMVKSWSMKFLIEFNADVLSKEQVLNLLQTAGFSCGLGEWRPECDGNSGTFGIARKKKKE